MSTMDKGPPSEQIDSPGTDVPSIVTDPADARTVEADAGQPSSPSSYDGPKSATLFRRATASSPVIMGLVVLGLILAFSVARPGAFPSLANARNILMDASSLLVMATAMTFVMVAGGIDLSIGSVLVFSGICGAKIMNGLGTDNIGTVLLGAGVAMLAGLAWGLFNGICITRLRVPALITTLGTLGAALGAADLLTNGQDVTTVPQSLISFETGSFLGLSWLIWITALVVIVAGLVLAYTRFGRHTYIIGSNIEAGRRAGLNVDRHLLKLYAISGMLAGLAGMLSLARFATTTIGGHSTDALEVITGVVLGGTSLYGGIGTIIGTVVGIFIPSILNNGFTVMNVQPFWQQVAVGFTLIAAVYVDQIKRRQRDRV